MPQSAEIIGVTHVTFFYWRHKLLNALKQMNFDQTRHGVGVADQAGHIMLEPDCDVIQGYLISRPIPKDEIRAFLANCEAPFTLSIKW